MIANTVHAPSINGQLHLKAIGVGSAVIVLTALFLPLGFNPWGYSAFELPKVLLLRLAATLALGIALSRQPDWPARIGPQLRRSPWLRPVLAYSGALLLATLLSTNRSGSFWGIYERQQGLLTQLTYIALFLAAVFTLQGAAGQRKLWLALVWGSLPVVVYTLLQAAGHDPFRWQIDEAGSLLSTLGRTNFLGSYLVLVMPLTLAAWLSYLRSRSWRGQVFGLLLLAQAACLVLTKARAAWIGLAVAAGVAILVLALLSRRRRLILGLICAGGALAGLALLALFYLANQSALPGPLSRLHSMLDLSSGSAAARLAIWRAALALWAERPLLGYGLDSFAAQFPRVFPAELVYYQGRYVVVDRADNLWLDLAVNAGLAGVVAFVWLCLAWVRLVWRRVRTPRDWPSRALGIALIAAVAGHLADMQFSFEISATAAIFWLILALGIGLARDGQEFAGLAWAGSQPVSSLALLVATALAVGLLGLLAMRQTQADMALWQASQTSRSLESRTGEGGRAVRLVPLEPRYRLALAQILQERGDFSAAQAQLAVAERLSTGDPAIWQAQADLYVAWSIAESGRLPQAEALARQLVAYAPAVGTHYTRLGVVLAQQGDLSGATQALETATDLDRTDVAAFSSLAVVYEALHRPADADVVRQVAQILGETYRY